MTFKIDEFIEPCRTTGAFDIDAIQVSLNLNELKALASDFYANNFEFDERCQSTPRDFEIYKREINIMLKLMYAIQDCEVAA